MEELEIKGLTQCLLNADYLGVAGVFLMNGCYGCPFYPEQCDSVPVNCRWVNMSFENRRVDDDQR